MDVFASAVGECMTGCPFSTDLEVSYGSEIVVTDSELKAMEKIRSSPFVIVKM